MGIVQEKPEDHCGWGHGEQDFQKGVEVEVRKKRKLWIMKGLVGHLYYYYYFTSAKTSGLNQ